jgi:peptide deformylase
MYKFMEDQELVVLGNDKITGITCDDVVIEEFDEIKKLGEAMIRYCIENGGLGLAAPQVGVNLNMFVFMSRSNEFQIVLNPKIFPDKKRTNVVESCLSSPGEHYFLSRAKKTRLMFYFVKDGEMMSHSKNFTGETSFVIQHEYDHLIGETIATRGTLFSVDKEEDANNT